MEHYNKKTFFKASFAVALFVVSLLVAAPKAYALGETMNMYSKVPAFLESGIPPNLLLIIDNSSSMYDQAYTNPTNNNSCFVQDRVDGNADGDYVDAVDQINYDPSLEYAGYFSTDDSFAYKYNTATEQFEKVLSADAIAFCSTAAGTKYLSNTNKICMTIDGTDEDANNNGVLDAGEDTDGDGTLDLPVVSAFAASGTLLNWLASSKFDIEKGILTGGKFDSSNNQLVMESRGCLEELFVKKVSIQGVADGLDYYATLGVRPPDVSEKTADAAYNGSTNNSRIEIFAVTTDGFDMASCEAAIEAFEVGNLGTIKSETENCMQGSSLSVSDSNVAYNHIMQECWYFNKHGHWQNPTNTVNQLKKDCARVYKSTDDTLNVGGGVTPPPADYVAPETLSSTDICSGQYDPNLVALDEWGVGYVGRCWEPDNSVALVDSPCTAADTPKTDMTASLNAVGNYHYCDGSFWLECIGTYKAVNGKCVSGPGWQREQITDPLAPPPGVPSFVGWTNDGDPDAGDAEGFTGSEHCIDEVLVDYCGSMDVPTIVDPTGSLSSSGTTWVLPAVLIASAVNSQMGPPLQIGADTAMKGRIEQASAPTGIIHEYKYNLRIGAMAFNDGTASECAPVQETVSGRYTANLYDCLVDKDDSITAASVPDPTKLDGARITTYIGQGDAHIDKLSSDINDIRATAWTPSIEALYESIGYFTQNNLDDVDPTNDLRINSSDFIWDHDHASYSTWTNSTVYAANDQVKYTNVSGQTKLYFTLTGGTSNSTGGPEDDVGVHWQPYDPVIAACQENYVLMITDGSSSADTNQQVVDFIKTAGNNDGDNAVTWKTGVTEPANYECMAEDGLDADALPDHTLYGNSLLDDIVAYAGSSATAIYPTGYETIDGELKQTIDTHIVVAGDRPIPTDPALECEIDNLLTAAEANGATVYNGNNLSVLEDVLRNAFEGVGGEVSSGAAASVISHSRSGGGAIYQAIFYPKQVDTFLNEVEWTGDIHSLWLDSGGNIREDCSEATCAAAGDQILDPTVDRILEFYSDPASSSARARRYSDADGNGMYDKGSCSVAAYSTKESCEAAGHTWTYGVDFVADNIVLRDLKYIWSAGEWLSQANATTQRSYASTVDQRYIFTSFNGESMVPFVPADLRGALGTDQEYQAYFNASTAVNDEANDIANYIRGDDSQVYPDGVTSRNYRTRLIDWDNDGTLETYKLGDIIHSTPTLVGSPAENYDVIYKDESYRKFRKRYHYRRSMVYAGGNDGGLHAFNAGYYDKANNQFLKAPPVYPLTSPVTYETEFDLGAEMWQFIPKSALPHLKWLTDAKYNHVYYADLAPYIFDAKIFEPNDTKHPGGWGTVLVGGMRFGGGEIGIDLNGDGDDADSGEILRSSYYILDITDPEAPPVLLAEFTDQNLGLTLATPRAIAMLRCDLKTTSGPNVCPANTSDATTWPMDWYLAFGSGPKAPTPHQGMLGRSDQEARLYVLKLGGTGGAVQVAGGALPHVTHTQGAGDLPAGYNTPAVHGSFPKIIPAADFPNSFFSDVVTIDYDLSFQADSLYFGSVSEASPGIAGDDHNQHRGGLHRLVTDDDFSLTDKLDPSKWFLNTLFDTDKPVTAAPSVAIDGRRAWIFFGTGRFLDATFDKQINARQTYYGLKEIYDVTDKMDLASSYIAPRPNLVDVTNITVTNITGALNASPEDTNGLFLNAVTFKELNNEISEKSIGIDKYNGWKIDFGATGTAYEGERNIGRAAILGDLVSFTSYVPSVNQCDPEGESYLWAPYYRTGTAYYRNIIGLDPADGTTVLRRVSLGKGLATTPNIHSGNEDGSKAFVQTSTGAIVGIQQANPGVVKSGSISWREPIDE